MANNCGYSLRAIAKTKEALDRLLSIMEYKDTRRYIYRVRDVYKYDEGRIGDLFYADFEGDVAWSAHSWVYDRPSRELKISNGAQYTNLKVLCRVLGIAVEGWTCEEGFGFQEHFIIDNHGKVVTFDCVDMSPGFDNFCDWTPNIFKE